MELPSSVDALQEIVLQQQTTIEQQAERLAFLEEWNRLLRSQRFGAKSEKIPPEQGRPFNEAELEAPKADPGGPIEAEIEVPAHTRRRRGPRPLPDFLPIEEHLHDLSEAEKVCGNDASHRLVEISRETSDQLKFIPATVAIVRHIRPKYACPTCKDGVWIAPMPKLPIPKSLATPSLLAHVATSKYETRKRRRTDVRRRSRGPTVELLSHRGCPAVPSPKWGLTSVFGMGTGVAPTL